MNDWFTDYAEHALRVIDIETHWYELRGWITKNGRHILIGEEGGSSGGAGKSIDKSAKSDIIKAEEVNTMTISSIDTPIEQKHTGKGNPNAINTFGAELNNRQKELLEQLPEFDSRTTVPKDSVNMADLSALTAETGHEFAMFTKSNERLIVRGNETMVNIDVEEAKKLAKSGYKWSGHTHPGVDSNCLLASAGDKAILECFEQKTSSIYNSKGNFRTFERE